jgi:hypothetical protein
MTVSRLLAAQALRLVVALCIALATVIAVLTAVAVVLDVTGRQPVGQLGLFVPMSAGIITLMLAVARLAYLALARLVTRAPRSCL